MLKPVFEIKGGIVSFSAGFFILKWSPVYLETLFTVFLNVVLLVFE
ncbi:hypothetical protein HMPREF9371_1557 [Neisseria shayeganii 871]|uniref:Uncharacterized protein n=1 Tax=Neisseria shayeganii 871 TaxID=1032488 RepID=G4CIW8_9NEIS|nr:hypothetical protein HMPREF9371_1557 [Neisseria shayeganii 871]